MTELIPISVINIPKGRIMLDSLFHPSSVAVVGASRTVGKVGHDVLKNILVSGYKGKVYPINPKAAKILGLKSYKSLLDVRGNVEMAVIAVPAVIVPKIAEEAGEKNVKTLVVISAGFKESGIEGSRRENLLLEICKKHGIRLLGPNCLGVIDTFTPLNASFASLIPAKGNVAFVSQSGALGTAVLDWSLKEGIGFSKFLSLGNKADLNENDLMLDLSEDEKTKVILLYLEGVKDGKRFLKVAEEVTRKKPVVILKSGVTDAGARAVSSHTGTMAGSDLAFEVAFKQTGIIRVDTVQELFDLAEIFATQPLPQGPNVAVVTNAGGPGILATDAVEKNYLKMAPISAELRKNLREKLPPASGFNNPIDVLGDATAERYRFALEKVMQNEEVNSVIVILTPQAMTKPDGIAKAILEIKNAYPHKILIASFLGGELVDNAIKTLVKAKIPNYPFPERAITSLSAMVEYINYLNKITEKKIPSLKANRKKVKAIFKKVKEDNRVNLLASEAMEVAEAYNIPAPKIKMVTTKEKAISIAEEIGYPVVMKIESPQILHKTDIGGVKLNIKSKEEVAKSFNEILDNAHRYTPKAVLYGVNIQNMVPLGKEMIVGVHRDINFGPLIMFGLGGIYINFLRDVSFRLAPLTKKDVEEMISETKAHSLLRGIRGGERSDIESVVNIILRVSKLVTDFDEINELDINPLFVYKEGAGCQALDIKITIK